MGATAPAAHDRAAATRDRLLRAGERLIAERGLAAVSMRQVADAAGQANNSAVAYHIGTRDDLVLAVIRSHEEPMERLREKMVDALQDGPGVVEHVACLVRPLTDHLAELGAPSHYARFSAHVQSDPSLRALIDHDLPRPPSLERATAAVDEMLSGLPPSVAALREEMGRTVVVHTCAERERVLARDGGSPAAEWARTGAALIDALTGLLTAPVRPRP